MKTISLSIFCCTILPLSGIVGVSPASGQENLSPLAAPGSESTAFNLQTFLSQEFADFAAFEKALKASNADGTKAWEARLLFPFATGNFENLRSILDQTEELASKWQLAESELFSSMNEYEALLRALKARLCLDQGDVGAFQEHAGRVLWEDPNLAMIMAQWVMQHKAREKAASLKVPLDSVLETPDGASVSFASLVDGHKAVLLDFWASWCGPCIQLMPELKKKASLLRPQGIHVAGVNTENSEKARDGAQRFGIDFTWLVEPSDRSLSRLLEIDSIPRMVLIAPDGSVLFNGHPMDEQLNAAVAKLTAE
jgi:thiol-disulfide isomerase/thioredoxin